MSTLVLNVTNGYTSNVSYSVVYQANNVVVLDSSAAAIQGNINNTSNVSRTVTATVTTPVYVLINANTSLAQIYSGNLVTGTGTSTISLTPQDETILLYRDETLVADSAANGTKAWYTEINNITLNTTDRTIVIPNAITTCEISYAYRAWKKFINGNIRNLYYGVALRGENQAPPNGATSLSYYWLPYWYFGANWAIDVPANRPTASTLELKGSRIQRDDTGSRSGLVYVSPLSNGTQPAITIVTSVSTTFQDNTNDALATLNTQIATLSATLERIRRICRDELE